MHSASNASLVVASHFIEAARDSGYRSLGSALAELIDNSFEAKASEVTVRLQRKEDSQAPESVVTVADNGIGMDADTCHNSLRFGWSSRFDRRDSFGRYGMGLPNASLSHARRVEVFSSKDGRSASVSYLDADEFRKGSRVTLPEARRIPATLFRETHPFRRGTSVVWRKCDRLDNKKFGPLAKRLRTELGRLFRYQLWSGKKIKLNGEALLPLDPLFERAGCGLRGAAAYGPELTYEVAAPAGATSIVRVRFTELPVAEWHSLSNEQKNAAGIAKGAGVSIVRAGREVDFGWFFMGQKRRENYDDWWRSEVRFEPDLDELFGVTHTKQEVRPTEAMSAILSPDMERIARDLNARARKAFFTVKASEIKSESEKLAERYDNLIEPPLAAVTGRHGYPGPLRRGRRGRVAGLEYRLLLKKLSDTSFFVPELDGARLIVLLNEQHPFVHKAWSPQPAGQSDIFKGLRNRLELLILGAARAEVMIGKDKQSKLRMQRFRETWSNILATFLS